MIILQGYTSVWIVTQGYGIPYILPNNFIGAYCESGQYPANYAW